MNCFRKFPQFYDDILNSMEDKNDNNEDSHSTQEEAKLQEQNDIIKKEN